MIKFERVTSRPDAILPVRATKGSAGYDFFAAEDIIVPPIKNLIAHMEKENDPDKVYTLNDVADITKSLHTKPTLVSTGIKCRMDEPNTYLELAVRSSIPLKTWLILANGEAIIDADYYNNESNEGEIFFQFINLSPFFIYISKGDKIGQGIIKRYLTTDDDNAEGKRTGGFGSTSK